jgi:hypothetical protein
MRDRCQPGLRDLRVVLRRVEACSDGTDHLAIHNDRKSTLHFREALCRDGSDATVVDRVFKRLTWILEQRGCSSFAGCQFHAGEIGGMVHALDQDRPPTVVDYGNDSGQVIARGLRYLSRDEISRVNTFFSANCAVAAGGSDTTAPSRSPQAMAIRMMISLLAVEALN